MDKIICSLEEWDSILNYYRPNGSSKTWYIKELKKLSRPLMWGDWDIFSEDGEMFSQDYLKGKICPPIYHPNIEYRTVGDILENKHIYIINVFNMSFFNDNYDIGFKCINKKYLDDIRNGKSKILIMLTLEGYSGSETNQDLDVIEKWRIDANLPVGSVYYGTGNLIINQVYNGNIKCEPILDFEAWNNVNFTDVVEYQPIDDKNLFLVYNRNPRPHRVNFCIRLLKNEIFERGLVSLGDMKYYNNKTYIVEPHNEYQFNYLKSNSPFVIDSKPDLYYNLACDITTSDYQRTFISVISETLMDKNTLFISEKTWKPIMVGHPFIMLGCKHTLKFLKDLGYKTFDKWINEEYDNIEDDNDRRNAILVELKKLSLKSVDELKNIRNEMREVCQYNQKHFYVLYKKKYGPNNINGDISKIIEKIWEELI
jgi:hypothetical protein